MPLDISGSTIKCIMMEAKNLGTMIENVRAGEIPKLVSVT